MEKPLIKRDSPEALDVIKRYHGLGLLVGIFDETPGDYSPMHRHGAATLFVLSGSAEVELDGEPVVNYGVGDEISIGEQQGHAFRIGPDGLEYIFACSVAEAEAQNITKFMQKPPLQ